MNDFTNKFQKNAIKYSIIIPVRNEAEHINNCIQSIKKLDWNDSYEIIVIDNGSTDATIEIAKVAGAIVLQKTKCFVGAVRNEGVKVAKGEILCFIDADCIITPMWLTTLSNYSETIIGLKAGIFGAEYTLPSNSNILQKAWLSHVKGNYIGKAEIIPAGNMLISKELFQTIGGFNENITSGEDYEICCRVKECGLSVFHDYRFECIHFGNPKNLADFYKRERWHGRGMVADFKKPLHSKPLLISFFYLLNYIVIFFVSISSVLNPFFVRGYKFIFLLLICPPVVFALQRSLKNKQIRYFPLLSFLYCCYSVARSFSLIEILINMARNTLNKMRTNK